MKNWIVSIIIGLFIIGSIVFSCVRCSAIMNDPTVPDAVKWYMITK